MSHRLLLSIAALALLEVPAAAQYAAPYPPPPAPAPAPYYAAPAPAVRTGLTFGVGLGVGGMESEDGPIECVDCDDSAAGSFDLHVGWMVSPRLALNFEVWGTAQALDAAADVSLVQVLVLGSAQYWVTPRVWVKGGLGTAHLSESYADSDEPNELDTGAAVMVAAGLELISRPHFALDLQLRAGSGTYEALDERISQGSLQLGVSWY